MEVNGPGKTKPTEARKAYAEMARTSVKITVPRAREEFPVIKSPKLTPGARKSKAKKKSTRKRS